MTYTETLDWLYEQTPAFHLVGAGAYKPGLDTIRSLCAALGNPHERLRCIHVAGTNGKGSTASTLAAIFTAAGLRTGLYTSPHLVDFRERIRVNGEMISEAEVVSFVEHYRAMQLPLQPSFFELTTAMALHHFAAQECEVAVIEVGLGGRLDSTNIITPLLSVITNIALDHTGLLGSTPAAIAAEKAGIIKPGVPCVLGPGQSAEVTEVVRSKAAAEGAPLEMAPMVAHSRGADDRWVYEGDLHSELRGDFQPANMSTVLTAMTHFPEISRQAIAQGMAHVNSLTGLRGRMTEVEIEGRRVIYDTGHNPAAWDYIGPELARLKPDVMLVGFAADKDVEAIIARMPRGPHYVYTTPAGHRALLAAELAAMSPHHGEVVGEAHNAWKAALEATPVGGLLFVGGSNYLIACYPQLY